VTASLSLSVRRRPSAPQVQRLFQTAPWARDRSLAQIKVMLANTDLVASLWHGKDLVGFARVSTDFAFRAVLWDVIVERRWLGQGLGTRLVKGLLAHPRLKNVDQFWLYTTSKQGFYERLGFKAYPRNTMRLLRGRRAKA
jgi:N-acetylglutamate synthase-like GNAT family acetyltransferase